jgi:hypothetical protein
VTKNPFSRLLARPQAPHARKLLLTVPIHQQDIHVEH